MHNFWTMSLEGVDKVFSSHFQKETANETTFRMTWQTL